MHDAMTQTKGVGKMTIQTLVNPCMPVSTSVTRKNVTLTINPELVEKAHQLGLNISKITETALDNIIITLERGSSLQINEEPRARSLVRTKTLASGAGDRGFESHRARQERGEPTFDRKPFRGISQRM